MVFCEIPKGRRPASLILSREYFEEGRTAVYPETMTFHEARTVIGAAFGGKTAAKGDAMMNALLKPLGLNADDKTKDRQDVSSFCLGFFAYELLHRYGGVAVGIRGVGDDLRSVVVFREYDPVREARKQNVLDKIWDFVTNIRAYMFMKNDPSGLPELLSDKKQKKIFEDSLKDMDPIQTLLHEKHNTYGPKEKHWYIGLVATDPKFQGMGCGKDIMNLIANAADECQMSCYLESAKKTGPFYKKFGFEITENVTLPLGGDGISGYLMTRKPR